MFRDKSVECRVAHQMLFKELHARTCLRRKARWRGHFLLQKYTYFNIVQKKYAVLALVY